MKYYLGIDGGGTKTTAAVSDENGNIILRKTGRTINFYSVGMEKARENLAAVMAEITASLGEAVFAAAFIGCSALDKEADSQLTLSLCGGIINALKIRMHSDVYIALRAVGDVDCPCVAVCGTGSMAVAEDINGQLCVRGGWGHILGDEGSGYSIAVEALKSCCVLCDEGKKTQLVSSAEEYFGADSFRNIIDIIYSKETTKDVIAGFSVNVDSLAQSGDEKAEAIIINQAQKFSETVLSLLDEIQCCSVLGLHGGMFRHSRFFRDSFTESIRKKYPELEIRTLTTPAEDSAVAEARKL